MLRLSFEGVSSTSPFRTDPSAVFQVDGLTIRNADGKTIAMRRREAWEAGGQFYTHIDCIGPVTVAFKNAAARKTDVIGPLSQVYIDDGEIRGDDTILAMLDNDGQWWQPPTQKTWPVVILTDEMSHCFDSSDLPDD
jgi:hypothetical protein